MQFIHLNQGWAMLGLETPNKLPRNPRFPRSRVRKTNKPHAFTYLRVHHKAFRDILKRAQYYVSSQEGLR